MATNREHGKPKILVVDGDEEMRTSLRAMFECNHFNVTAVENVGEALHIIGTEHFDVLLSDLHMHGAAEGFTVVSAMRDANPDAVILMHAGYPAMVDARCATHSICQWVLEIVRYDSKQPPAEHLFSAQSTVLGAVSLSKGI